MCAKRRPRGAGTGEEAPAPRLRWPVERTNSWLSHFGQLRRNTDRTVAQRLGQFALAVALVLIVNLVKWADRWTDRSLAAYLRAL